MSLQKFRRRLLGGTFSPENIKPMSRVDNEDLRNCIATGATFSGITFRGVKFGKGDFLSAVFQDCCFQDCDLGGARLMGTRIYRCLFRGCDLDQTDFVAADIRDTFFVQCRAQYSNWTRAYFFNGSISQTDLHGAVLDFAQTNNLDFRGSNFWGAVIPLGCQIFRKNRFDARQVQFLLALLCQIDGDTTDVANIVLPKYKRVVERLVVSEQDS